MNSIASGECKRIMWLSSVIVPIVKRLEHLHTDIDGLWMERVSEHLHSNSDNIMFFISLGKGRSEVRGGDDRVKYYQYPTQYINKPKILKSIFKELIQEFKPDVIHVWGTEYAHSLAMVQASQDLGYLENLIVDIQGITSIVARDFTIGLPIKTVYSFTLRDIIRRRNIYLEQKHFLRKSQDEVRVLKAVKNVFGRTDFDKSYAMYTNKEIAYYHCNRILRDAFYTSPKWELKDSGHKSIFVTQAQYPIKGAHILLEALSFLINKYPNVKLKIAGSNIVGDDTLQSRIRISSYGRYLKGLIATYGLRNHIRFLGRLSSEELIQEYLDCSLFVSPSLVENLSNATMEAMYLGVPVVSSDVGGVNRLISHNRNGYLYPATNPYMLALYIDEILQNGPADGITEHAVQTAETLCDRKRNLSIIEDVYTELTKH